MDMLNNPGCSSRMEVEISAGDAAAGVNPLTEKAELIASSASRLTRSSRGIPSGRDFHYFNNFPAFKSPSADLSRGSESLLRALGEAPALWTSGRPLEFPAADLDDAHDWLVDLNSDLLERAAASMDEFKAVREKEEHSRVKSAKMEDGGFQIVCGNKKKKVGACGSLPPSPAPAPAPMDTIGVKVAVRDEKTEAPPLRVPFHNPMIRKPQVIYNILVNNSNQPFEHVWLERSADGNSFVHPLARLSLLDFVDRNVSEGELVQPPPFESTPFKLVEGVNDLKELAAKLRNVNEFAVDLEHNQYRSFQGLTCLMQISTRAEDFVIDTLKLRIHVGPYLRDIFKDPSKRKVMHGADRDIIWLQRDFGIYVCNLFDTCQASKALELKRNSLKHLLQHFCGVDANKEYQNADWRLRPLPDEMLKYAREDTHYLLHIHDLMRLRLLSASANGNDLLLQVYQRSCEICMQLYEKELLTDRSYLYIYGLNEAGFDSKQLAIASGLCEWRDNVARAEDESTGYVLPNKALLEIARQMPQTSRKLRRIVKSRHPFVEKYITSIVSIINSSIANSCAFEDIAEQLKKSLSEKLSMQNIEDFRGSIVPPVIGDCASDGSNASMLNAEKFATPSAVMRDPLEVIISEDTSCGSALITKNRQEKQLPLFSSDADFPICTPAICTETDEKIENFVKPSLTTKSEMSASVQVFRKSTCAFGALLGSTSRKWNQHRAINREKDENQNKVEQIKSSVALPFYSFSGKEKTVDANSNEVIQGLPEQQVHEPEEASILEDIILFDNCTEVKSPVESAKKEDGQKHRQWFPRLKENIEGSQVVSETVDMLSVSDLSSRFQFQSVNERRGLNQKQNHRQADNCPLQVKPFDYAAARRENDFNGVHEECKAKDADEVINSPDFGDLDKGLALHRSRREERRAGEFQKPRRRQAFPASGNRSTTYF